MSKKKPALSKAALARVKSFEVRSNVQESLSGVRKRDNKLAFLAGIGALVIALGSQLGYAALHPTAASPSNSASSLTNRVPEASVSENRTWTGSMKVNNGVLGFQLDGAKAPQAVANFVSLSKSGFYSGVSCHRLTTENIYVLQCGDPKGDGTGGPGYSFGPIENAPKDNFYPAGTIAMARQGGNGSSQGSQFFIVYEDTTLGSDAAGGYTVFGKVTSGLEIVKAIAKVGTDNGTGDGKPKSAVNLSAVNVK